MTKIRLKQIEKIKLSEIADCQILSFDSVGDIVNKYKITSTKSIDTIPVRDVNGNITVGDAINADDAVSKSFLESAIEKIKLTSPDNSINIKKGVSNTAIEVNPGGIVEGTMQKRSGGKLAGCQYLFEDITNKSIEISRSSQYKASFPIGVKSQLAISQILVDSIHDSQILLNTASTNENYGNLIETYSALQVNGSNSSIARGAVNAGQKLFSLVSNGYTSNSNFSKAFDLSIYAASDFSSSVNSVFGMSQAIDGEMVTVMQSDSEGDIYLSGGLCLGVSNISETGMVVFDGTHFKGYNGDEWLNLDVQTINSGSGVTTDINVTIDLGGYSKGNTINQGQTLEDIVSRLLSPYIEAYVENFTISGTVDGEQFADTVIECGKELYIDYASFYMNLDSDGQLPTGCSVDGIGFGGSFTATEGQTLVYSSDSPEVPAVLDTPGSIVWYVTGNNLVTNSYTIEWKYLAFFGAVADFDGVLNLQQSSYVSEDGQSFMCTSDNSNKDYYTYLAVPASIVNSNTLVKKNCLNVTNAFTKSFITYILSDGTEVPYVLYTSNATGAFSSGNIIKLK